MIEKDKVVESGIVYIGDRPVGPGHPPFIIAEMSGNHNHSLTRALAIVKAAADAGVHALKLQTYTADTMTIAKDSNEFVITDTGSPWYGQSLYSLYEQAHTPWEWHKPIMERCRELGLLCFSTPFDSSAVDFLVELDMPAYKIASFEVVDLPLIRKAAATGKPLIISTGMAVQEEIKEAIQVARSSGCSDIILLHCTSTYPARPEDSNLATIPHMRDFFGIQVGISDHTLGLGVALASIGLGSIVIEKHFTLSRSEGGVDAVFSLEPEEMAALVTESERAWRALGKVSYGPVEREKQSLRFRRSLYIVKDMKKGELFTTDNLRPIRPGLGLAPKFLEKILGKRVAVDVKMGTPVKWELIA